MQVYRFKLGLSLVLLKNIDSYIDCESTACMAMESVEHTWRNKPVPVNIGYFLRFDPAAVRKYGLGVTYISD